MRPLRTPGHRLRDTALAVCLGWLMLQNAVLLTMAPWDRLGVLSTVGGAMLKAMWVLCAPVVSAVLAAFLGWAFITGLLHDSSGVQAGAGKELHHG